MLIVDFSSPLSLPRVLGQNSGGPVALSRPNVSRGPLLSPKAASEVPKGSSGPASRLSGPPVPTLGRGFSEGEDILLDLSPPSSKSLSAAKVLAQESAPSFVQGFLNTRMLCCCESFFLSGFKVLLNAETWRETFSVFIIIAKKIEVYIVLYLFNN